MESKDLVQRLRMSGVNIAADGDRIAETKKYELEVYMETCPIVVFTNKQEKWQAAFRMEDLVSRVMWTEGNAPYMKGEYTSTEPLVNSIIGDMQKDEPLYPIIAAANIGFFSMQLVNDFTNNFFGNLFKEPNSRR